MREARVVIIGGGFGGLNCARQLARRRDVSITLIDRRNYHLLQPLLYQVAMAGLSPGDIAAPFARGTRLIVEKEWRSHANRRLAAQPKGAPPVSLAAPPIPSSAPSSELREPPEEEPATSTWASPLEGWDEPTVAYPSVRES